MEELIPKSSSEYLFNKILQSSIASPTEDEEKKPTTNNSLKSDEILVKVCPYLFKKENKGSSTADSEVSNTIHPKFKKIHQRLTKHIQKRLNHHEDTTNIETHLKTLMDNLMWNNGEVVDFFNDQEEWLFSNTKYSDFKGTQPPISNNTSQSSSDLQNKDLIWEQLKTEIFEILLNVLGETSITLYEFRHALRTALYQLQLKEREYRRIPKELLEMAIDKFLPNAQSGRSLVQFIVSELKRLKSETDSISNEVKDGGNQSGLQTTHSPNQSTSQRALKIISMTIMQLLQRRLIPIPGIEMLDDKNQVDQVRDKTRKGYRGVVDFSKKVYLDYLYKKDEIPKRKKDFTINMTENEQSNSTSMSNWSNSFSNRVNNMSRSSSLSREMENWMNQYRDIVGPINIQVPLFRNPKGKIKEMEERIKKKESDLKTRLKYIESLEHVWDNSDHKTVISGMINVSLLRKFEYIKNKKRKEIIERLILRPYIERNDYVLPQNLAKEFKSLFTERVKVKLSNMELESFLEKRGEIGEMLGENLNVRYPSFLGNVSSITQEDIDEYREMHSVERQQSEQIQIRSFQFLKSMKEEFGPVTFSKFQQLISSEGPLHNLPMVQNLLKKAESYIETNDRFKHIYPYLNKTDIELEGASLLYEWVFGGHDQEEKLKDLLSLQSPKRSKIDSLIEQVSKYILLSELPEPLNEKDDPYIPYKIEERLNVVRDYCINFFLTKDEKDNAGVHFILNFANSLQETVDYEAYYNDSSQQHSERPFKNIEEQFEIERKQVIKNAAIKHIQNKICKTPEEQQWFNSMLEKYQLKKDQDEKTSQSSKTKSFLRKTGVINDEVSFNDNVQKHVKRYGKYQYRLTQEEEQKLLLQQLELETRGRSITQPPIYERYITEQRRKMLFE